MRHDLSQKGFLLKTILLKLWLQSFAARTEDASTCCSQQATHPMRLMTS